MVTYFKVLDKDLQAKDGGVFDYSSYVASGEWTPTIENIKECSVGYHLTPYWNMFLTDVSDRIFEVEFKDAMISENEVGVVDKIVCKSFRFIKEFKPEYKNNRNTGYCNTGDWNTGDWNTGHRNTGDRNTGDNNTGYCNTGDRNTGDNNTGHRNTGDWNTGYCNTGDYNTGHRNTGHRNTGHRNTGHRNTGDWNTGYCNTGSLNTKRPLNTQLFNKEISFKKYDKIVFPKYFYFKLDNKDYKKCFIKSFMNASKEDVLLTLKIPYFNYKLFEEISGITRKMIIEKVK